MQTYIFTVVIQGEDIQDQAEQIREKVIDMVVFSKVSNLHVTEVVRVSREVK